MGKITSRSWAEKDDPMFTGRFTISKGRTRTMSITKTNVKNQKDQVRAMDKGNISIILGSNLRRKNND